VGDILNDLSLAKLKALKEKHVARKKKEERACAWCDVTVPMIQSQRFCCTNCRADYSRAKATAQFEQLVESERLWKAERQELLREHAAERAGWAAELAEVKRQLALALR